MQSAPYLKNELFVTPGHPTSHLLLGIIFRDSGNTIPAIFALSRFLILEPRSERASGALEALNQLINGGVSVEDGKKVNITVNPNASKDEGDFDSLQMALQIVSAGRFLEENDDKSPMEQSIEQFRSFFQIMLEMTENETERYKFTGECYMPYFIEMQKNDHVEAFTYWIHSGGNNPEITAWLQNNPQKVQAFIDWNNQYTWPTK